MASNLSRDACNHPALKLNNDSTVPKACQIQCLVDKLYDTCDCEHFIVLGSLHCQIQCWAHKWNTTAFQGIKVSEHAWLGTHSLEHYSSGPKWRAPDHNSNRVDMRYKYSLHVLSIKHQQNCTGLKKPVIVTHTSVCVCVSQEVYPSNLSHKYYRLCIFKRSLSAFPKLMLWILIKIHEIPGKGKDQVKILVYSHFLLNHTFIPLIEAIK